MLHEAPASTNQGTPAGSSDVTRDGRVMLGGAAWGRCFCPAWPQDGSGVESMLPVHSWDFMLALTSRDSGPGLLAVNMIGIWCCERSAKIIRVTQKCQYITHHLRVVVNWLICANLISNNERWTKIISNIFPNTLFKPCTESKEQNTNYSYFIHAYFISVKYRHFFVGKMCVKMLITRMRK